MWWLENNAAARRLVRLSGAMALAGLLAGCFEPLYAKKTFDGGPGIRTALSGVDIKLANDANGTPTARVGVELRNQLIFELTGGGETPRPTHRLVIALSSNHQPVIVDIQTNRADIENFALNASYTLTDIRSNKVVFTGQTGARVSFNIPGQQQRFAGARGLRDAENRAAKEIAETLRSRLASYFVAGG